jgi:hypothetical protein
MNYGLRKFLLITHITLAVGWIGAVAAYVILVVAAMTTDDEPTLRAAWIAMDLIGWRLIVPLALTSLLTGCVIALATPWGLFRHYWVLLSLVLTVVATGVLLLHMPAVSNLAGAAAESDAATLRAGLRGELLHAGLGLVILLAIEALNVYKPQGLTAYGRRARPHAAMVAQPGGPGPQLPSAPPSTTPFWLKVIAFHAIALAVLFAIVHAAGGGMRH